MPVTQPGIAKTHNHEPHEYRFSTPGSGIISPATATGLRIPRAARKMPHLLTRMKLKPFLIAGIILFRHEQSISKRVPF